MPFTAGWRTGCRRPLAGDLERRLLEAHGRGDRAALVALYEAAARAAEDEGRQDAAGFFMTHAYVFALEAGLDDAARLKAWLVERDRESEG